MSPVQAGKGSVARPLPVCIVGAGGLGLVLATVLCRGGAQVTLVCRQAARAELARRGGIEVGGALVAACALDDTAVAGQSVRFTANPGEAWASEAVLFTVKGPDLQGLVERVAAERPVPPGHAYFVGLQNGVVKDDIMSEVLGPERVVGGATLLGCQRLEAGSAIVSGLGTTFLGEFQGHSRGRAAALSAALSAAGIPVCIVEDVRSLLWTKFCHAIGIFGVSALTGLPSYEIFARPALARAYLSLVGEAASVGLAEQVVVADFPGLTIAANLGLPLDEAVAAMVARAGPRTTGPPGFSSMAQDLALGRPTEVDETFGDLVRRARRHGVDVPRSELVYRVVRGREEGSPRGALKRD